MPRRRRCTPAAPVADANPFHAFANAVCAIDDQHRDALKQIEESGLPPELKQKAKAELDKLVEERMDALCGHRDTFMPRDDRDPPFHTENISFTGSRCETMGITNCRTENNTRNEGRSETETGDAE